MSRMICRESTVELKVEGKVVAAMSSFSYPAPLPPVESLPKRERNLAVGFFQMEEEVGRHHSIQPVTQLHAADKQALNEASRACGKLGWWNPMMEELSWLTGFPQSLVVGVIVAWARLQPRTEADWNRIWTGE